MALLLLLPTPDERIHAQPRPLPRPGHRLAGGDPLVHAARELGRHADGGASDHSHRLRSVRDGHGVRGLRAARERAGAEPGHRPAPRLDRGADRTARRPHRARQRRPFRAVGGVGRARRVVLRRADRPRDHHRTEPDVRDARGTGGAPLAARTRSGIPSARVDRRWRSGAVELDHAGWRLSRSAVLGPRVGRGGERVRGHGRVVLAAAAPARLAPGPQVGRRRSQPRVVRRRLAALLVRVQPRRLDDRRAAAGQGSPRCLHKGLGHREHSGRSHQRDDRTGHPCGVRRGPGRPQDVATLSPRADGRPGPHHLPHLRRAGVGRRGLLRSTPAPIGARPALRSGG